MSTPLERLYAAANAAGEREYDEMLAQNYSIFEANLCRITAIGSFLAGARYIQDTVNKALPRG